MEAAQPGSSSGLAGWVSLAQVEAVRPAELALRQGSDHQYVKRYRVKRRGSIEGKMDE